MRCIPLSGGQLFEIHGSKFKLRPVGYLGEASVLRVAHPMLIFHISEHALDFLFSQSVQVIAHRSMPDVLSQLRKILPDVPCYRLLTFGILNTLPEGRAIPVQIRPALVLLVTISVGRRVMQRMVFRTGHIVIVVIVDIFPPRMYTLFGLRPCVGGGKDASTLKAPLADLGNL